MKIRIYKPRCTLKPPTALHEAFILGLEANGDRAEVDAGPKFTYRQDCDAAFVQGWMKARLEGQKWGRNDIIRNHKRDNLPLLVGERGHLGDRRQYSALCWNGFLNTADWGYLENMPADRWHALRIELKPWKFTDNQKAPILFATQVPGDANLQLGSHYEWIADTVRAICKMTNRPVLVRPHPKALERHRWDASIKSRLPANATIDLPNRRTLREAVVSAYAVVCWNSTSAVESTIAGIPTFTFHPNAMAWEVTMHDLMLLADEHCGLMREKCLKEFNRKQWLSDIAYRQWNMEEVRSGLAWSYIRKGITPPVNMELGEL